MEVYFQVVLTETGKKAVVDMKEFIKLKDSEYQKVIPAEFIEEVKLQNGLVCLDTIKNYLSTRTFNSLRRNGCAGSFYEVLSAIEDMRMLQWSGVGKGTVQEIIDLFLQMDLIERKTDRDYKPCEGYVRKAPLYKKEEERSEYDKMITGEMYTPEEALSVYRSIMEAGGVIWDPGIKKNGGYISEGAINLAKGCTEKQAANEIDFFGKKSWCDKPYTRYYMEIKDSDEEVAYVDAWCK